MKYAVLDIYLKIFILVHNIFIFILLVMFSSIICERSKRPLNVHERSWFKIIHKHSQTFTNIHKRSQTFTNVHKHSQTFTNIHKRSQTFTNVHDRSQTFLSIPRTFYNVPNGF